MKLLTKVNRCLVETGPRVRSPQIQLIPRAATLEALKCIAFQVDGNERLVEELNPYFTPDA